MGTAHFRLYKVDIDDDGENDREHVFFSDGCVPELLPGDEVPLVDELDRTLGEYTAFDLGNSTTLPGLLLVWDKVSSVPSKTLSFDTKGTYIYSLYGTEKYRLNIEKLETEHKNFTPVCGYG